MKQVQLNDVQENFEQIYEDVMLRGGLLNIFKEMGNAILVSEKIWHGMIETLNLLSIPGMRVSICCGMRKPANDSKTVLDW